MNLVDNLGFLQSDIGVHEEKKKAFLCVCLMC